MTRKVCEYHGEDEWKGMVRELNRARLVLRAALETLADGEERLRNVPELLERMEYVFRAAETAMVFVGEHAVEHCPVVTWEEAERNGG